MKARKIFLPALFVVLVLCDLLFAYRFLSDQGPAAASEDRPEDGDGSEAYCDVHFQDGRSCVAYQDLSVGIGFLQEQAGKPAGSVESRIRRKRARFLADHREEIQRKIETASDEELWAYFDDSLIVGNSRALCFSYHHFLPEDKVYAASSATILEITKWKENIIAANPERIYFCFGINEMSTGEWNASSFVKDYETALQSLRSALPETTLCVCSILPAESWTYQNHPEYANMSLWNQGLQGMCARNGYVFIDNDGLSSALQDQYDEDGIHFYGSFCPTLARNMLKASYEKPSRLEQLLLQEQEG